LKLGRDWLTGAALYAKPWLVPEALVPAACVYVIVLEMVLVWGLLSRRPRLRHAVLVQLALFHVTSFTVVGWFYPLLMFGLLSILLFEDRGLEPEERRAFVGTAAAFAAFQLVPWAFPGDSALTGQGRLFALHMFDARVVCTGGAKVGATDVALSSTEDEQRTRCDPIVILARTRQLCRDDARAKIDVAIDARRATDAVARPLVRIEDACRTRPEYAVWRANAWIVGAR
jgi:hypothetical protein